MVRTIANFFCIIISCLIPFVRVRYPETSSLIALAKFEVRRFLAFSYFLKISCIVCTDFGVALSNPRDLFPFGTIKMQPVAISGQFIKTDIYYR